MRRNGNRDGSIDVRKSLFVGRNLYYCNLGARWRGEEMMKQYCSTALRRAAATTTSHAARSCLADAIDELDHLRIENERLNAENARLREALKDARNNGLIYWEPRTERGHVSKAQMLSRIDAALAGEEKK